MDLTNDAYIIQIRTKTATERHYRDKIGWVKVSTRGRTFRATAEQVLNRVVPVLASIKPSVAVEVERHASPLPRRQPYPFDLTNAMRNTIKRVNWRARIPEKGDLVAVHHDVAGAMLPGVSTRMCRGP